MTEIWKVYLFGNKSGTNTNQKRPPRSTHFDNDHSYDQYDQYENEPSQNTNYVQTQISTLAVEIDDGFSNNCSSSNSMYRYQTQDVKTRLTIQTIEELLTHKPLLTIDL